MRDPADYERPGGFTEMVANSGTEELRVHKKDALNIASEFALLHAERAIEALQLNQNEAESVRGKIKSIFEAAHSSTNPVNAIEKDLNDKIASVERLNINFRAAAERMNRAITSAVTPALEILSVFYRDKVLPPVGGN